MSASFSMTEYYISLEFPYDLIIIIPSQSVHLLHVNYDEQFAACSEFPLLVR